MPAVPWSARCSRTSRSRPADVRPTRLLGALIGFSVALRLVARTTGAGWTLVVVCCVGAAVVIGAVWPPILLRRLGVRVDAPADAVAGRPLSLVVGLDGA